MYTDSEVAGLDECGRLDIFSQSQGRLRVRAEGAHARSARAFCESYDQPNLRENIRSPPHRFSPRLSLLGRRLDRMSQNTRSVNSSPVSGARRGGSRMFCEVRPLSMPEDSSRLGNSDHESTCESDFACQDSSVSDSDSSWLDSNSEYDSRRFSPVKITFPSRSHSVLSTGSSPSLTSTGLSKSADRPPSYTDHEFACDLDFPWLHSCSPKSDLACCLSTNVAPAFKPPFPKLNHRSADHPGQISTEAEFIQFRRYHSIDEFHTKRRKYPAAQSRRQLFDTDLHEPSCSATTQLLQGPSSCARRARKADSFRRTSSKHKLVVAFPQRVHLESLATATGGGNRDSPEEEKNSEKIRRPSVKNVQKKIGASCKNMRTFDKRPSKALKAGRSDTAANQVKPVTTTMHDKSKPSQYIPPSVRTRCGCCTGLIDHITPSQLAFYPAEARRFYESNNAPKYVCISCAVQFMSRASLSFSCSKYKRLKEGLCRIMNRAVRDLKFGHYSEAVRAYLVLEKDSGIKRHLWKLQDDYVRSVMHEQVCTFVSLNRCFVVHSNQLAKRTHESCGSCGGLISFFKFPRYRQWLLNAWDF